MHKTLSSCTHALTHARTHAQRTHARTHATHARTHVLTSAFQQDGERFNMRQAIGRLPDSVAASQREYITAI